MWMAQRLAQAAATRPAGENGRVTGAHMVSGQSLYRGVPVTGPWGLHWLPPVGAQTVLVQTDSGPACLGAVMVQQALEPGELLLLSQGGARIELKNSGEVLINGQRFAPQEA